jgi:signal transduction histidine kinase/ActR/RegA family two-component response regulator
MAVALVVAYRSIRQSESSNASVSHAQQVMSALVAVEGATADLIFSSDAQSIDKATADVSTHLDELASLTGDNVSQQVRLNELRVEIAGLGRGRHIAGESGTAARTQAVVPERLSQLLRAIRGEELRLLTARVAADSRSTQGLRTILIVVGAGCGGLLVCVFGLVVRAEQTRRETEAVLRRANEELDVRVATRTAELKAAVHREQDLRRDAETSNRLKDDFLMTVSHELRTPLNALLGWADMLRLGIVPSDRQQRALDSIYENAKLQADLIADLLDTARILTGKLRIERTVVDLGQIIRDAVDVVAPAADSKGLQLRVAIDERLDGFLGDPARLQQVVWNLVSNAVKFTHHGSVSVTATRDDVKHEARLVVADTGDGISPEFMPYVFDRFRQEKTGTTRPHGGLGLGLSIVRELVELHGGTIRVDHGEERGAVFTVSLPFSGDAIDGARSPDRMPAAPDMPALDGLRVLVIDDDAAAREMVTATLEFCGARVASAASALDARQKLPTATWDLLLIDIAMPGEDGYSLIRDIRSTGLKLPAAALTAQARDIERVQALEAGFDAHIAKPVEARALAQTVASLVGGARAAMT